MPEPEGSGFRVVSVGRPAEFQRVISDGGRHQGRYVLLFVRRSGQGGMRLGVSASGKVGTKVARNRLRRLLREAVRREKNVLGPGFDIVLIARASAVGRGLDEISADLRGLFARVKSQFDGQGGAGQVC